MIHLNAYMSSNNAGNGEVGTVLSLRREREVKELKEEMLRVLLKWSAI
jgi:hypothetical protein